MCVFALKPIERFQLCLQRRRHRDFFFLSRFVVLIPSHFYLFSVFSLEMFKAPGQRCTHNSVLLLFLHIQTDLFLLFLLLSLFSWILTLRIFAKRTNRPIRIGKSFVFAIEKPQGEKHEQQCNAKIEDKMAS